MRRAVLFLFSACLAGCVLVDRDVAVHDGPAYYDDGGYYADPYVYGDTYDPGLRGYVATGYYSGRPWPYYGGYYRYRDRREPDHRDHDRNDGPGRERLRDSRDGAAAPGRGDDGEPRVRTRTGFQQPSAPPAARPGPRSSAGHGAPSRR